MRKKALTIIVLLLVTGCCCWFKNCEVCNDEKYGPVAINLSEFSSQVIYHYLSRKQAVPRNFDENQFIQILRNLPADQVKQKDVDSMESRFDIKAHAIDGGFSVMLCEEKGKKLMEDFASPHDSECRFDLNSVEIKSWNENVDCSFEVDWQKYCKKP
jgi:hypothetical protein